MCKALVFSIEEFSVFDGPGIRTTVFLKGCPLRCSWCHNPEGQAYENEIIKAQSGCVGCGACLKAGNGMLTEASIPVCPNRLLRYSAQAYTPQTLLQKLEDNFDILKMSGGGITFSGGEPLAHPEFLAECLALLQGNIHTALQTSGYASNDVFTRILALTDYVLFDIKLVNKDAHIHYTGVSNEKILHNFNSLVESGTPFTVRTPLIPGVTDTTENLTDIALLLKAKHINKIELLPYNKAAGSKYAAIGRKYTPDFDEAFPVNPQIALFESYGIQASIL